MSMKVATAFLSYTPTASTEATDHPATNLALYDRPQRTWRSTSAAGSITLGGSGSVAAVFLNNANFATVDISGGAFTSAGIPVPVDLRVARRKIWIETPAASLPLTLTPHTPDGGAGFYELGVAVVLGTVVELSDWPSFPRWTPKQARTITPFPSGGREINEDGPLYLEWTLRNDQFIRSDAVPVLAELLAVIGAGAAATPVIWENRGPTEHAYLFQRLEDPPFQEDFVTFGAELTFTEAI